MQYRSLPIGGHYKPHAYSTATPSPLSRSRGGTRSPSPTPSTSSICSKATSIEDPGDWPKIDQIRPLYDDIHSRRLNDRFGQMEVLEDADEPSEQSRGEGSSRMSQNPPSDKDRSASHDASGTSEKGKEKRRFPEEEDEDLLRETNDRFVLFPIKYREVRASPPRSVSSSIRPCLCLRTLTIADLGSVQSLAGVLLDGRGDRPVARLA